MAACVVAKNMLPYLMDVARGYQYYPKDDESGLAKIILCCVWIASSLLVIAAIVYREGNFESLIPLRGDYEQVPTDDRASKASPRKTPFSMHREPPDESPDAYNMFNPADLPPRLAEYANMVYSACEDLGNFFGFQDSSVRNQAEHLLILLSNSRRYMSSHILPPSRRRPWQRRSARAVAATARLRPAPY